MTTGAFTVEVRWDAAGLRSFDKMLGTFEGRELWRRMEAALKRELRPIPAMMRAEAAAQGVHRRSGRLARGTRVRTLRKRPGEAVALTVGPTSPYRHLVIRGHEIVTHAGIRTGGRTRAFPFVDPVLDRYAGDIMERVGDAVWAAGLRR